MNQQHPAWTDDSPNNPRYNHAVRPEATQCPVCERVYEFEWEDDPEFEPYGGEWWPGSAEWWRHQEAGYDFLCSVHCWRKAEKQVRSE